MITTYGAKRIWAVSVEWLREEWPIALLGGIVLAGITLIAVLIWADSDWHRKCRDSGGTAVQTGSSWVGVVSGKMVIPVETPIYECRYGEDKRQ